MNRRTSYQSPSCAEFLTASCTLTQHMRIASCLCRCVSALCGVPLDTCVRQETARARVWVQRAGRRASAPRRLQLEPVWPDQFQLVLDAAAGQRCMLPAAACSARPQSGRRPPNSQTSILSCPIPAIQYLPTTNPCMKTVKCIILARK